MDKEQVDRKREEGRIEGYKALFLWAKGTVVQKGTSNYGIEGDKDNERVGEQEGKGVEI